MALGWLGEMDVYWCGDETVMRMGKSDVGRGSCAFGDWVWMCGARCSGCGCEVMDGGCGLDASGESVGTCLSVTEGGVDMMWEHWSGSESDNVGDSGRGVPVMGDVGCVWIVDCCEGRGW